MFREFGLKGTRGLFFAAEEEKPFSASSCAVLNMGCD